MKAGFGGRCPGSLVRENECSSLKSAQNVFKPTTDGEWFAPTGRNVPDWLIVEKGNVTGADTNAATNIGMRGAEWILYDGGGSK